MSPYENKIRKALDRRRTAGKLHEFALPLLSKEGRIGIPGSTTRAAAYFSIGDLPSEAVQDIGELIQDFEHRKDKSS